MSQPPSSESRSGGGLALPLALAASLLVISAAFEIGAAPASDLLAGLELPGILAIVFPVGLLLYAALVRAYGLVCGASERNRVHHRLAAAAPVTTLLALAPNLFSIADTYLLRTTHLSHLYLAATIAAPPALLLPRETRELAQRPAAIRVAARIHPWVSGVVFAWPAIVVGEAVVWGINYGTSGAVLFLNAVLLAAVIWLLFALTNRFTFAVATSLSLYAAFMTCDVLKMRFLRSTIHPLDVPALRDLLVLNVFGVWPTILALTLGVASTVALGMLFRIRSGSIARGRRFTAAAVALLTLGGLVGSEAFPLGASLLARAGVNWPNWFPPQRARRNGLLLDFALNVSDLYVSAPPNYSEPAIAAIRRRYSTSVSPSSPPDHQRINLIVYLIEAFTDLGDLGIRFTSDPIPNFHALALEHTSGSVISPVFGGASANSEFEILTGLAMYFLPAESCPYNQYVRRNLPSLARFLKERGYRTSAIHVERLQAFNYYAVYPRLGFDRAISLFDDPRVPLDVAGRRPSDDALVDAIVSVSDEPGPFFIFAFPNSTHFPWNYPGYLDADLDIVSPVLSSAAHDELKTYANALRTADRALGRLVDHFRNSSAKTVIVALGDHRPALSVEAYAAAGFLDHGNPDSLAQRYRCPILFWSNFPLPCDPIHCSNGFLAPRILRRLGYEPDGFFVLNEAFGSRIRVLSSFVETADGARFSRDSVTPAAREIIDDMRLIQYDLLFGDQLALRPLPPAALTSIPRAE